MADSYEIVLAMDIRADLTDDELAELRWHLGQGPLPERLPIGTDQYLPAFPLGDPGDPGCEWETAEPEPLFARHGPAHHIGGALVAVLADRETPRSRSLTVRQELHPDEFYSLRTILDWLGRHSTRDSGEHYLGHLRFYENTETTPLVLSNGTIAVPEEITEYTPDWQPPGP
ncbi:MAG: hypothetical protein WBA97_35870 [Actinophytocola sp.]|uniref:hypothetical protein n=1 Tax=Actinophytocola sp. TaxID=1872138 RepID=UPI003C708965